MAVRPLFDTEGRTCIGKAATGLTISKGDMLVSNGSGYLTQVAAGGNVTPTHIALEDKTTTANGDEVLCVRAHMGMFEADTDAAVSIVDRYTYCDIASASTLDPDASTDDIFFVEDYVGAAESSTKVIGWFAYAAPNA